MQALKIGLHHIAGLVGVVSGSALSLLSAYDSAPSDHPYLPAPWGAMLFVLTLAAYALYGYGRGVRRALWTAAWVSVAAMIGLEITARLLDAGDLNNPDPNDPVVSPIAGISCFRCSSPWSLQESDFDSGAVAETAPTSRPVIGSCLRAGLLLVLPPAVLVRPST